MKRVGGYGAYLLRHVVFVVFGDERPRRARGHRLAPRGGEHGAEHVVVYVFVLHVAAGLRAKDAVLQQTHAERRGAVGNAVHVIQLNVGGELLRCLVVIALHPNVHVDVLLAQLAAADEPVAAAQHLSQSLNVPAVHHSHGPGGNAEIVVDFRSLRGAELGRVGRLGHGVRSGVYRHGEYPVGVRQLYLGGYLVAVGAVAALVAGEILQQHVGLLLRRAHVLRRGALRHYQHREQCRFHVLSHR